MKNAKEYLWIIIFQSQLLTAKHGISIHGHILTCLLCVVYNCAKGTRYWEGWLNRPNSIEMKTKG